MSKKKSNNKDNGHTEEQIEWLDKDHNRRFFRLFGQSLTEAVMSEDLDDKRQYDEADEMLKKLKKVTQYIKRKNTILRKRARTYDKQEKS